jgi:ATP-binding cassette subfamily F protein uup
VGIAARSADSPVAEHNRKAPVKAKTTSEARPLPADQKLSFNEKREKDALPRRSEAMEAQQRELEDLLSDPKTYRERAAEISGFRAQCATLIQDIESAMTRWMELESRS